MNNHLTLISYTCYQSARWEIKKMVGTVNKIISNLFHLDIHAAWNLKPEVGAITVRTLIQPHPLSRDGHSGWKRLLPHGLDLLL